MIKLQLPAHVEVLTSLFAYRYSMPGGTRPVWLCVTDEQGWFITDERRELAGAFARCMVGKGDPNILLEEAAIRMLAAICDYLERSA